MSKYFDKDAVLSDENFDTEFERPSKSQKKREMLALQTFGEELVKLTKNQLKKLALPEILAESITEAQQIQSMNAKRRQLQYIGKILRDIENEEIERLKRDYVRLLRGE